ncbi:MAG: HWE histidine kinase domain-containing protein [Alphaproteobacteria bacterium]
MADLAIEPGSRQAQIDAIFSRLGDRDGPFRLIAESAPVMLWMGDEHGKCLYLNRIQREFWGVAIEDVATFDWSTTMHPEDMPRLFEAFGAAMGAQIPFEVEARYFRVDGASRVLHTKAEPRFAADGAFLGMIGVNTDVTETRDAERQRMLLINELNHRVKNTLATVQSLVMQTMRHASSPADVQSLLEARLVALSRAHDVLTQQNWQGAEVSELVQRAMSAFRTPQARIDARGPRARLTPKQALALSMALHELATNAAKYGALSGESGRVDIYWKVQAEDDGRVLTMHWRESGGPPVTAPSRRGFGARLIERNLSSDLGGAASLSFLPEGLAADFRVPLAGAEELAKQQG